MSNAPDAVNVYAVIGNVPPGGENSITLGPHVCIGRTHAGQQRRPGLNPVLMREFGISFDGQELWIVSPRPLERVLQRDGERSARVGRRASISFRSLIRSGRRLKSRIPVCSDKGMQHLRGDSRGP